MTTTDSSSAEFFEAKYRGAEGHDPWRFADAAYELQRYDAVLRALAGRRFRRAFEPGCSVGVLTERLAAVCDAVDACDFAETAVAAARERCAGLRGVTIRCEALRADAAWDAYDLVVLCEIGYYFAAEDWAALVERMVREVRPGTMVLACHWLGSSTDHAQSGDAVHEALRHEKLRPLMAERHTGFRLEMWERTA